MHCFVCTFNSFICAVTCCCSRLSLSNYVHQRSWDDIVIISICINLCTWYRKKLLTYLNQILQKDKPWAKDQLIIILGLIWILINFYFYEIMRKGIFNTFWLIQILYQFYFFKIGRHGLPTFPMLVKVWTPVFSSWFWFPQQARSSV